MGQLFALPIEKLLESRIHEVRAGAMSIMDKQARSRQNDITDTFKIAEILVNDKEDLIQKATGGWIREAGRRDRPRLLQFLDRHAAPMPRTLLRYAIEHLDAKQRKFYLEKKKIS